MPAVPKPLVRALIDAEDAKSKALYAHASSPTNGSLEMLVQAAVDYAMALAAVEAAMKGDKP